jgi:acetylornithine deacetylase/succinyl-diaminopimelate desuccinylase-like protein
VTRSGSVERMSEPEELPEVVRIARDLIRIDTTNWGEGRSAGEREAAEYVGAYLEDLGLAPEYYEPIPRRTNLSVRVPGRDRDKAALVPPSPTTGASTRSAARSGTACCGAAGRST